MLTYTHTHCKFTHTQSHTHTHCRFTHTHTVTHAHHKFAHTHTHSHTHTHTLQIHTHSHTPLVLYKGIKLHLWYTLMVRYPPLLPLSSSPNDLDNKAFSVLKSGLVLGSIDQQLFITLYNPLGQLSGGSIIYPSSICSRTSSDSYK